MVLAIILLGALTVIGVAAVSLSTRERSSAAAYARVDFITQCANAAQAKLWAEMAQYGVAYLGAGSQVSSIRLPDGTTITAPAHYDSQKADGSMPAVKEVAIKVESSAEGTVAERDCTNNACGLMPLGATQIIFAHCKLEVAGRPVEMELELGIKFAL
jgi:hypothetical protein